MNTRTKSILAALLTALLALFLGATCNAQPGGGIQFTPPPAHDEIQVDAGNSCGCMGKVAQFSCAPECTYFVIEDTLAPGSGNSVTRITPLVGKTFTVEFTYDGGTYSYEGIEKVVFNYYACQLFYPAGFGSFFIKGFTSIKIIATND